MNTEHPCLKIKIKKPYWTTNQYSDTQFEKDGYKLNRKFEKDGYKVKISLFGHFGTYRLCIKK